MEGILLTFIKKTAIVICFILFLLSIYHDLFSKNPTSLQNKQEEQAVSLYNDHSFEIVQVKVKAGDTVLSIIERLNKERSEEIEADKFLRDFEKLNPNVNPHQLEKNTIYYFPLY